jgi:ribosome modulation factor
MTQEVPPPRNVADEGRDSCLRGLPREDCPYPPGTDEREAWLAGWDKAAGSGCAGSPEKTAS